MYWNILGYTGTVNHPLLMERLSSLSFWDTTLYSFFISFYFLFLVSKWWVRSFPRGSNLVLWFYISPRGWKLPNTFLLPTSLPSSRTSHTTAYSTSPGAYLTRSLNILQLHVLLLLYFSPITHLHAQGYESPLALFLLCSLSHFTPIHQQLPLALPWI